MTRCGLPNRSWRSANRRPFDLVNRQVVQLLLGHEDIGTTAKYAHAMVEDAPAAMQAANNTEIHTDAQNAEVNQLKILKKSG